MQQTKNASIMYFIFPKSLCVCSYILFVALLGVNKIATVHFWYSLPVLILVYIPLQYLMFWYPDNIKQKNLAYNICNGICSFITLGIFFGVYFGLFFSTIQYTLEAVDDCQVIGKQSTNINGVDNYSILYIDFNKDGHNMLGYGCLSTNYNQPAGTPYILPQMFYQANDSFLCTDTKSTASYYKPKRQLYNQRNRITAAGNTQSKLLNCFYYWSNVKLADWMCQSFSINHEVLTKKQKCYVHYFKNNLDTETAINNSMNRLELKTVKQFALITFNPLPVPVGQYMCLIIFIFCPFISSLSVLFNLLTQNLVHHLEKQKKLSKIYQNVSIIKLKEKQFDTNKTQYKEDQVQFIQKTEQSKAIEEGSPALTIINAINRQFQEEDVVVELINIQENPNNLKQSLHFEQHNNKIEVNNFNLNNAIDNDQKDEQQTTLFDQVQIKCKDKQSLNLNQQKQNDSSQNQSENNSFQLVNESYSQKKIIK